MDLSCNSVYAARNFNRAAENFKVNHGPGDTLPGFILLRYTWIPARMKSGSGARQRRQGPINRKARAHIGRGYFSICCSEALTRVLSDFYAGIVCLYSRQENGAQARVYAHITPY